MPVCAVSRRRLFGSLACRFLMKKSEDTRGTHRIRCESLSMAVRSGDLCVSCVIVYDAAHRAPAANRPHRDACPSSVRAPQPIHLLLPRKVKLSNCAACELYVSLGAASERKIFSKISLGAELRASGRRVAENSGNLAALAGVRTRTRVAPWQWPAS